MRMIDRRPLTQVLKKQLWECIVKVPDVNKMQNLKERADELARRL